MSFIVTLLNQKGGVGKTSTAYHLSGTLARSGRSVLLIDNDPQASLTQGFWGPQATREIDASEKRGRPVRSDSIAIPSSLVRPTGIEGVSLVPRIAIPDARQHETARRLGRVAEPGCATSSMRSSRIRHRPDRLPAEPSPVQLGRAGGERFDRRPLQAEDFGSQGLAPVQEAIAAVQAGPNPDLRLQGYLLTDVRQAADGPRLLRGDAPRDVRVGRLRGSVPRAKDFIEAVAARLPISHYKPKSAAAKSIQVVADELIARLSRRHEAGLERGAA